MSTWTVQRNVPGAGINKAWTARFRAATPAEVFSKAGWARSVGGANPYLTLFARAGIRREQADADVAALRIHELPTARGCTYVLGAGDFAWALLLGQGAAEATVKVLDKLGVERGEVTALAEKTLQILQGAAHPLDPKQLKDRLGDAVRSLGEEGKKKGASTTLPTVFGLLQADGRIRRVPVNGRLDQQRYAYTMWGLPLAAQSPEEARAKLMENYLGWTCGATLKQTQWFTAFSVAQSKAALAVVGAVETPASDTPGLWMLPADADAASTFITPRKSRSSYLRETTLFSCSDVTPQIILPKKTATASCSAPSLRFRQICRITPSLIAAALSAYGSTIPAPRALPTGSSTPRQKP